jgi:hypothetical protein
MKTDMRTAWLANRDGIREKWSLSYQEAQYVTIYACCSQRSSGARRSRNLRDMGSIG